jgi:hypothetical protein
VPPQAYIIFVAVSAHKANSFALGADFIILLNLTVEFVHDCIREIDSVILTEAKPLD